MAGRYYIYLQPGASKTEYLGEVEIDQSHYGIPGDGLIKAIKIKLIAPPVDGAANKALIKFLAKHFKIAQSEITIVKGEKSKYKIVELGL